jgi:hypothetical protein
MDYHPAHLIPGYRHPAQPLKHRPQVHNVVIHFGPNLKMAKTAERCLLGAQIGTVEVYDSKTTWALAAKKILSSRNFEWVAIWNSDVDNFSPNFSEFLAALLPNVGMASPSIRGYSYSWMAPGSKNR